MANKQTTVKKDSKEGASGVVNPRDLVWPLDQYGFTTLLRKEGVRAVGRLKGDPDKMNVFIETLRMLAGHAEAKMADNAAEQERAAEVAAWREKARLERAAQDKELERKRLEDLVISTKASLAVLDAGDEGAE